MAIYKNQAKKIVPSIFALFFTNTYAADVIHVPTEQSLCTSDEVSVVSCEIESHKRNIISICANSLEISWSRLKTSKG
ncbi:hypothetical protein SFSGTM_23730 [Sulfuriferula nivalis]|uniref:Uncharacterized protein n=1 Tax=Sulfuriferula nivalis TaxID=2675298 RepID=A0A809RJJ4_9PROT|nr:hypothetical protein SFSGTM_23730 [Sulfuriferula nivalis]